MFDITLGQAKIASRPGGKMLIGIPDYDENYVEHMKTNHPDKPVRLDL